MKTSLCADKMGWGEHSREERTLQEVFLDPSSLLMPGRTPFFLRHLPWLLGTPPSPLRLLEGHSPEGNSTFWGQGRARTTAWWEEKGRVGNGFPSLFPVKSSPLFTGLQVHVVPCSLVSPPWKCSSLLLAGPASTGRLKYPFSSCLLCCQCPGRQVCEHC